MSEPSIVKPFVPFQKLGVSFGKLVGVVVVLGVVGWKAGPPLFHEVQTSFVAREFRELGVWGTYQHHFFKFFGALDELARLDHENEELNQKVAHLEKTSILTESRNTELELARLNEMVEERLRDDAGSELATALKTIRYEVPRNLSYNQIHVLAVGSFKTGDYEKSAILFNHLLNLKEETKFKVPENYLLSGISWFHLNHFHLAQQDFKNAEGGSNLADPSHRKALLWQALVQKSLGKKALAQDSLLRFLEFYPHSEEGNWVNGHRSPASVGEKDE